jgi:hypothetical protein
MALFRDSADPVWLLGIPFGPVITANLIALVVAVRMMRLKRHLQPHH